MAKRDKLLAAIRNNPKEVSFEDLDTLLRWHGFTCHELSGGSHHTYSHPTGLCITVPKKRKMLSCYVKDVLRLVDALDENSV